MAQASPLHQASPLRQSKYCVMKRAHSQPAPVEPPPDEAVRKLLSKVGGTLEQALDSRELKWSSIELDADDAKVVAHVVAASTVLQKLVLGANSIGDAGAAAIAEALKVNRVLTTLVLHFSHISDAGAAAIAGALKVNVVLRELWLNNNSIGDEGAADLGEALRVNRVLTSLNLYKNKVRHDGSRHGRGHIPGN